MQIVSAAGVKVEYALSSIMNIEQASFAGDYITIDDFNEHYERTYLLLDIDQNILGYYMWYPQNDNQAYLYSIAIDKYHQGNGYSKLMLEHFLTVSGYNTHCLHVNPSNTKAMHLYSKYGFVQTQFIENFYEDGASAALMFK